MESDAIIDLNVGGVHFCTYQSTLLKEPQSALSQYFGGNLDVEVGVSGDQPSSPPMTMRRVVVKKPDGSYFLDRDGNLFRYILDYFRNDRKLYLPEGFREHRRLFEEAKFYRLEEMVKVLKPYLLGSVATNSSGTSLSDVALQNGPPLSAGLNDGGFITIGYRGTFAFGRDGQADVKFRKINRILICGKYQLCRDVFGDTLNESRDPDRGGEDRYTARLYLKHNFLEQAFDMLADCGYRLLSSCASGTSGQSDIMRTTGIEGEEQRWNHYNEFVFYRPPSTFLAAP